MLISSLCNAEALWTCKANNTDCAFREVELIKMECKEQRFKDHLGHYSVHIICYLPKRRYIIPNNVG